MKISLIKIRNVLGITECEIRPGRITEIQGKNGQGKTSVLEAIKATVIQERKEGAGGVKLAGLLRDDADSGEVYMLLDNGVEISRRFTKTGADGPVVSLPGVGELRSSADYLSQIADAISVNPIAILLADDDQRTQLILQTIPLSVTPEQIASCGIPITPAIEKAIRTSHALEVCDSIENGIVQERRDIGRDAKKAKATADRLSQTLPPGHDGQDWQAVLQQKTALLEALTRMIQSVHERAAAVAEAERASAAKLKEDAALAARTRRDEAIAIARKAYDDAVLRHTTECAKSISAVEDLYAEELDLISKTHDQTVNEGVSLHRTEVERLSAEIAEAQQRTSDKARLDMLMGVIEGHASEAKGLQERYDEHTRRLDAIRSLRKSLTESLPIPGLEIVNGKATVDGHPFRRANLARQIEVAFELAPMRFRSGGTRFVCVDGLECLDSDTYAAIEDKVRRDDLQLIGSRMVSGKTFDVISSD
jgi:energy-coupling factor transporter ATP-binding protein EcfA2